MGTVLGIAVVAVLVLAVVALYRWAVHWTATVEPSDADVAAKVHRLQRGTLVALFGGVTVSFVGNAALRLWVPGHRHGAVATWLPLVLAVLVVAPMLAVGRPVRAAIGRLRHADPRTPARGRKLFTGLVMALVGGAVAVGLALLLPRHGAGASLLRVAVLGVALVLTQLLLAPLLLFATMARPVSEECRQRFQQLADRMGVRVRGFRVLPSRRQRVANAAQIGGLPDLRYIAVTDYLVDNMTPEQLDAVVAHELAHAAKHHVLKKAGAWLLTWAGFQAAFLALTRGHAGRPVLATAPVLLAVAYLVVQGAVGVRLERQADRVAAGVVGAEAMASSLERLGQLNDTQLDTGRGWNLLTQHPGLGQRIEDARRMAAEPYPVAGRPGTQADVPSRTEPPSQRP
jgi:Zn-dependent protease with chaperone function